MTPDATLDLSLMEGLRTGLATFLGLPFQLEPGRAKGVVIGAPFDGGVIHRPGARLGPWALRSASLGLGRQAHPLRLQGDAEPADTWGPHPGSMAATPPRGLSTRPKP